MKRLRTGVIGVGYLGQFHAEKYAKNPDVEFIGVVDTDRVRAEQVAQKLQTAALPDLSSMLGAVDAVSIVVPTAFHHRIAKQCLEQGVHILLEKPITVTIEQADELIALAEQKGLVLQVGHIERFNPAVTVLKTLLKSPRYMQAERSAPFTVRCTDVSVILDLMIHDLDIVTDLAGSIPKAVSAAGRAVITDEIDAVIARIIYENGCIADVIASRISDEKKRVLRVFDGPVVYTADYQAQKAFRASRADGAVPQFVTTELSTERRDTLNEEITAFIRSVQTGSRPLVSGIEAKRALVLAQAITSNIKQGIAEFIPIS